MIYACFIFANLVYLLDLILSYLCILAVRKKFEKAAAGNRCEFEERYAFLIENDAQVTDICQNGYHCTETSFNVLGKYIDIYIYFFIYLILNKFFSFIHCLCIEYRG
jgi:hypothetical protein